jgi:membrane protein implicated in regulation of membrane protease activity
MLRALTPSLMLVAVIEAAAAVAYSLGAPVWVFYVAVVLALVAVLPAYERWDQQHHPRG